jgi:hypothetical protein
MFDEEIIGCGVYLPAAKDPEVSNALSSSLLEELGALKVFFESTEYNEFWLK